MDGLEISYLHFLTIKTMCHKQIDQNHIVFINQVLMCQKFDFVLPLKIVLDFPAELEIDFLTNLFVFP